MPALDSSDLGGALGALRRLRRRIGRSWQLVRGIDAEDAVLVYQMGKVASTSVFHSLLDLPGCRAYHVHRMNPETIARLRAAYLERGMSPLDERMGLALYRRIAEPRRPARVISLVREPIGRNISAFFQGLDGYAGVADAHLHLSTDALVECFLDRYLHDLPLEWFEVELGATLGIDVYAHDFPKDRGWLEIREPPYRLLLMHHDLTDEIKEARIAELIGRPDYRLRRVNEASTKGYAEAYRAFRDRIRVPADHADRMLGSRYAKHFFDAEQLAATRARWTGLPQA